MKGNRHMSSRRQRDVVVGVALVILIALGWWVLQASVSSSKGLQPDEILAELKDQWTHPGRFEWPWQEDNEQQLIEELLAHGEKAVPGLIEALNDEEIIVRRAGAQLLGMLGSKAGSAVAALTEHLEEDEDVAKEAAWALGEIGPAAQPALLPLIRSLRREAIASWVGVASVSQIGAAREQDVPELIELVRHRDPVVQMGAVTALENTGPAAVLAVPALKEMLNSPDEAFRTSSAFALWRITSNVDTTLLILVKALSSADWTERIFAVSALGKMGPDALPARPEVEALAKSDPYENVRGSARKALEKIDGSPP